MICSTDCERNHHHLCDGWYGHQTTPCECPCHAAASIEQTEAEGVRPGRCPVTEKRPGGQLVQCILGARHGSVRHEFLESPVTPTENGENH